MECEGGGGGICLELIVVYRGSDTLRLWCGVVPDS